MDILCTLIQKVLDFTVVLVGQRLRYVLFYSGNIKELKKEAENLNAARKDMQSKIDAAQNNNEEIKETVKVWMQKVDEIASKGDKFFEEESHAHTRCSHRSCPNLWLRYKLSREAKKMAIELEQMNGEVGKFDQVSTRRLLPQGTGHFSLVSEEFESRLSTTKEIMKALDDPVVQMIGVYGLGGVGKTTLAKQVAKKAAEEKFFDKVLFVEVKRNSVKEIQSQIASLLGLTDLQSDNESIRARVLHQRLEKEKSLLVVLDDLWQRIDFDQVGIPSVDQGNSHRKFIFTSRHENLLSSQMNCKRNIKVGLLSEEEAWELFKEMAEINEHFDDRDLLSKAMEVSQKCARLPVAIVAVAKALRNNKNLVDWKDALQRLNSYCSRNISGIEEVDSSIKLSYDYLKKELKSTFLLSAMFSQDPLIAELFMYVVGLGFLEGVHNMEAARNRLDALVHQLKASSLLLDSYPKDRFAIHDIVRDIALSIAFEEQLALVRRRAKVDDWPNEYQPESCTAICLDQCDIRGLPEVLNGPKVQFFYLNSKDPKLSIPSSFFNGMQEVKVLSLSNMTFSSLPSSMSLLNKLITLSLHSCTLKDIALVAHLKELKILNLSNSRIKRLPCEVGQLGCLKILNLSDCYQLEMIPPNILSNLKKLEELYMSGNLVRWEAGGLNEGKKRASLDELKHLQKLSTLEICIPDTSVLPKDLFLENSLERYKISIGRYDFYDYEFSRALTLVANNNINMEYGVFKLFERVEELTLENLNGITSLNQNNVTTQTFCKLQAIKVRHCDQLKSLFTISMVEMLSRLKTIEVSNCKSLEEIVAFVEEENVEEGSAMNVIKFLQLRSLVLNDLPALITDFCFNNKVAFPRLETLNLASVNCHSIWDVPTSTGTGTQISEIVESSQMRAVSNDPLSHSSFSNLKTLKVKKCNFLLKLIPLHILKSLSNLEELEIKDCVSLEVVFDFGEFNNYEETHIFPLKTLCLSDLPKLKTVCSKDSQVTVSFQNLQELVIENCDRLEADEKNIWDIFTSKSGGTRSHIKAQTFCKLRTIKVSSCDQLKSLFSVFMTEIVSRLERIEVSKCKSLEEIVTFGDKENVENGSAMNVIKFDQLHTLELNDLPALVTDFCFNKMIFPKLETLSLASVNCRSIWDIPISVGTGTQISEIVESSQMRTMTNDSLLDRSFSNLKTLKVTKCDFLLKLIPLHILKSLRNLEVLEIKDCASLEVVFDFGEFTNYEETYTFRLKTLLLSDLSTLKTVWSRDFKGFVSFQSLQKLEIINSNKLEIFEGVNEKVFPKLEELMLTGRLAKMMWNGEFQAYHFSTVKVLSLRDTYDKAATFPYGLFYGFPKLEQLHVSISSFFVIFSCPKRHLDNHAQNAMSIKRLGLSFMNKLKHIWDGKCQFDHILRNLKALEVSFCQRLINLGPSFVALEHLTKLDVKYCNELINLLTSSTARTLMQLTSLKIRSCKKMKEIITNGEDVKNEIVFVKLKTLGLDQLPSCKSFCCHNYTFNFPLLDEVTIEECPRFKIFCPGALTTPLLKGVKVGNDEVHWQNNLNDTIHQLFNEKGSLFGNLDVKIDEYSELIDVWNRKLASNSSFSNLTSLVMDNCGFLSNHVIPSYVLTSFINLERLEVRNCDSVEVVFDLGGIDIDKEAHKLQAIPLRFLTIKHLPNLKYVWNKDPYTIHCFQHLVGMFAYECENLRSIFPASIAKVLTKLWILKIKSCGIEVIVAESQTQTSTIHFVFPKLQFLHLIKLPNLKNFYPQRHTIEWPGLESMKVGQCKNVKVFSWEKPNIIEKEAVDAVENDRYPLFLFEKVVPQLYQLVLNQDLVKMIMNDQFQDHLFNKVSILMIDNFIEDEPLVFQYSFLERFSNLTNLEVSHSSFKEIFPYQGPSSDPPRKISMLTSLILTSLDQLQNIWNENSQIHPILQSLKSLDVNHCYRLINLAPSSASFDNLSWLTVSGCHHLGYLLTTSTARSLVHLERLVIEDCKMMEEIVTNEGKDMEDIIVLKKLNHMKLIDLPVLKHFCSHACNFEFPSLSNVTIRGCSKIKAFCPGDLVTPLLEDVKVEEDHERWEGNLNKTLELLFVKKEGLDYLGG